MTVINHGCLPKITKQLKFKNLKDFNVSQMGKKNHANHILFSKSSKFDLQALALLMLLR